MHILREKLFELKKQREQLINEFYTINPNFEEKNISKSFNLELKAEYFSKSELIEILNEGNGINLNSNLAKNSFEYIYFINIKLLEEVKMLFLNNDEIAIKFKDYGMSKSLIEFHIIFLYKDGKRNSVKLKNNEINYIKNGNFGDLDSIKIALRVNGIGESYIQNILLYTVKTEKKLQARKINKKIKDFNVLFIGDEFTTRSFEHEFNLLKVQPYKWKDSIDFNEIDLFFCESAWLGNDGHWSNMVGTKGPRDNTHLLELVRWCKNNNVPTIFWNKEDPFHYNVFIETAKHFDFVFTTDASSISSYLSDGCDKVNTFAFAAQPIYHNPIEKYVRKEKVVFAGAYYGDKFPERTEVMDNMIEISGQFGIEIFDRNYNNPSSPNQFPNKFRNYIVGTLKGDEIDYAYKGYKIALNVNSIVDSPTMFARRVYEILASNTPVVSSESLGIKNVFGDLVLATNNIDLLKDKISIFFKNEDYYKKSCLLGLREVLEKHTYTKRIEDMLQFMKIDYIKDEVKVTVVGIVKNKDDYNKLLSYYNKQTFKEKELLILLDIFPGYLDILNNNNDSNTKTFLLDYLHHYTSIEQLTKSKYVSFFDLNNYYSENYLIDLMLATKYAKNAHIVKSSEKNYMFSDKGKLDRALLNVSNINIGRPEKLVSKFLSKDFSLNEWFYTGSQFFYIDNYNFIENIELQKSKNKKIKEVTV